MRVGIVGWRGMVGSVLLQRMLEERDFDHIEPTFFSTSAAGGKGPDIGRATGPLQDASDVAAGIWTPGAAMGEKLIPRLVRNAGLTFKVES